MPKPALLLLHGSIGASEQFGPLDALLQHDFQVHTLDFEGHGRAPMRDRPFRVEHFAENVLDYLDQHGIAKTRVFGYSMGGFVAFDLALTHPQRIDSFVTLGTKFAWDASVARREEGFADPAKIRAKVPDFAITLDQRHAAGWELVLAKSREQLWSLVERGGFRPEQAANVQHRVRVMVGDRDTTTSIEESLEIYRALKNGQFEVLPGTPHPLEKVNARRLASSLRDFFGSA